MVNFEETPTIPEYFRGKKIFITGGSGFMGKVLIEKILRSCPDISNIYVLMRSKKGKSPEERIKIMTDTPLFNRLKQENPENIKKITPILGDVTEIGLGLSPESRKLLIDEVNIVYHAAASVRFDDPLKDALLMNTRGTREVVHLSREIKNLEILVHVSTTYCQTDKKVIEEKVYPVQADWREAIRAAEHVDPHILNILTPHYMGAMPNTYTFTKSLSEHVVNDLCDGQIPTVIFRPSIVISTMEDPVAGWIDNFNGPVGILVASGKGILRSVYTQPNLTADYIPVDLVIKGIIISTWAKAIEKNYEEKLRVSVYNASNNNINNITIKQLVDIGRGLCYDYPLNNTLWYPSGCVTTCYPNHFLRVIFFHILPALFIDGLLKLTGQKPMLLKIQRKIYIANMALQYFITQEWTFINDKTAKLEDLLSPEDKKLFGYGRKDIDPLEYFTNALMGTRRYLLKEDDSTMEQAKVHSKRMYVLYILFNGLWYLGMFYLIFFQLDLLGHLGNVIDRAYDYIREL
ncbi:putative fatty acyl-CoA reductase CG5065 [Anthonomus grandis grandis]|uniref:putative fatty acyl-CoA reductase CG5065 n=1 Tax=Anthonomus grandis grandis TaxID=2921223 RepID=UPI002166514F|nr:putative fatty acyl-CoA reductase CG5065 [Anthonomus grandis grandis]XP_050301951.1 putative fatty acyl-CoA reductase CG5065 [Anthonomus grandis grandis]XP_050301952.1 putative fatty acyl-CoA reductase CG5065 [Anthonomus grandis grandis]XP_050301953.1 putative fatty acyl-CoA reductase CG5065 [Anthonomus grandis grandis]XP_050301954.1 putative fatty acyl-CoA reductase CG5065 [Anthonomus grandis grandis]XP_050301955.1 putative fatty acyl-CoA reductase CG5065 [Anthonomus grandis grandis]